MIRRPPRSTLFPTRRSSDLAIASGAYILTTRAAYERVGTHETVKQSVAEDVALAQAYVRHHLDIFLTHGLEFIDRKSTRLNSSHLVISYAVFCLKKKKKQRHNLD